MNNKTNNNSLMKSFSITIFTAVLLSSVAAAMLCLNCTLRATKSETAIKEGNKNKNIILIDVI